MHVQYFVPDTMYKSKQWTLPMVKQHSIETTWTSTRCGWHQYKSVHASMLHEQPQRKPGTYSMHVIHHLSNMHALLLYFHLSINTTWADYPMCMSPFVYDHLHLKFTGHYSQHLFCTGSGRRGLSNGCVCTWLDRLWPTWGHLQCQANPRFSCSRCCKLIKNTKSHSCALFFLLCLVIV